jgi:putative flippase GtrA
MEHLKKIIAFRVTRFGIAGIINTATSFAVLNIVFYSLHLNKLVSIMIATACAIAVSFILNRNFVFQDKDRPAMKLARFVLVSVVGVFVIQNSVYVLCIALLHGHEAGIIGAFRNVSGYQLGSNFVDINLSNVVASLAVMFWNYNGYRIFVFNGKRRGNEIIEDINPEAA